MSLKITPLSGNVFADLGFGKEEAEHLRIRSILMIEVRKLINERNLTQSKAAKIMKVHATANQRSRSREDRSL